jgi:hypothetical protein
MTIDQKELIENYLNKVDIIWQGIVIEGRDQARDFLEDFINFIKE